MDALASFVAQLLNGVDLQHVAAKARFEGERLDRLEDARKADLLRAALEEDERNTLFQIKVLRARADTAAAP